MKIYRVELIQDIIDLLPIAEQNIPGALNSMSEEGWKLTQFLPAPLEVDHQAIFEKDGY